MPGHDAGSTFASLSVRNYKLYFWGQSVSVAGSRVQTVALGWLVLQISHSGTAVGIVTAIRFLPLLLLCPYGGLLADRMNRPRLMFGTQFVAGVISAVLAIVVVAHLDSLVVIYLLALGLGLVNVLANPVRQTLLHDLVPRELLPNAIALNSISVNVARVAGPLLSGGLIATVGVAPCFAINAGSFVAVLASLAAMRPSELYPSEPAVRGRGQLRDGFRYVLRTPDILLPMMMIALIGAFAWEFEVTLPVLATQTFGGGAGSYSAMLAAVGVGAAAAGLWVARARDISIRTSAQSALGLGVILILAAVAANIYIEMVVLVIVGWATISFSVRAKSTLQVTASPHMRGRVMAIWAVAWQGTTPIGGPILGWIGEHYGARWPLVVGAATALIVGAYALVYTTRRHAATAEKANNDAGSDVGQSTVSNPDLASGGPE